MEAGKLAFRDASLFDVPFLEQEYKTRRIMIENMQVHSNDVEMIYCDPDSKGIAVRDNFVRMPEASLEDAQGIPCLRQPT